ncbi:MAG: N-acetyltransferase [Flavobacteriaceae bacterium]|nr:N-acetyltransferase [Flavobacteriaceae bacterium]|tara:strand:- start:1332 stop:1913 length:582 start_codon:yes stop_codon:yes gene_type:complete
MKTNFFAHPSACIDDGAKIGSGTKIWHWVHVSSKAVIGENVTLGQNVFVADNVSIGASCKVQNNVSVYEGVTLEEGVFCGPSMVFTNVYNPRSMIDRKDEFRPTLVKSNATLGANCTIICGVTIGQSAFVGAGTLINRDVKPYALMVGVPGKQIGWMSESGETIPLPIEGSGSYICPHSGSKYVLKDDSLIKE